VRVLGAAPSAEPADGSHGPAAPPAPPAAVEAEASFEPPAPARSPGPTAPVGADVRQALAARYERGMAALDEDDYERALTEFESLVRDVQNLDGGRALFVQRDDGHWEYRKDALGELYALAALRSGLVYMELSTRVEPERWSGERFCRALRARPDAVLATMRTLKITARARRSFVAARTRCHANGGWRSPTTSPPNLSESADDITLPIEPR
jgi:hypothetical protein